jgi:hypothetical protein
MCNFAHQSAYELVYDFLPKVVNNLIFDQFFLNCVDKRL